MASCELIDQTESILREAEDALDESDESTEVSSTTVCRTMLACARAICQEVAALRRMVHSIETDVTEIDYKLPEQD